MGQRSTNPAPVLRLRLATVFAAQFFDFGTFTLMVGRNGIVTELNPVVSQGFMIFGMPFLALAKIMLVVLICSIVVLLGRGGESSRPARGLAAFVTILAVLAGMIGGVSNVAVS